MLNMQKTLLGLALVATVSASGFAFAEATDAPMVVSINGSVTLPACQPTLFACPSCSSINEQTVRLPNYNVDGTDTSLIPGETAFGTPVRFAMRLNPDKNICLLPVSMKATADTTEINETLILTNNSDAGADNVGIELKIRVLGGSFENLVGLGETKISELKLFHPERIALLQAGYFKTNNEPPIAGLVQTSTTITFLYN